LSEAIRFRSELEFLIAADPFRPFTLVMVSGDRYVVESSPEITLFEETLIIVPLRRSGHNVIRFNQVIAIEISDAA
jgi:hypothetical protein